GAKLAIERRYQDVPHESALADFAATRAACVARLEALSDAEWSRAGVLEGVGRITIETLVERWLAHDRAHLAELEALSGGDCGAETAWGHELALR
ncbi:MAG TPA: DinB family protein, partial [Planctomycetota bacterium]|nr:DinB family protein [Planctomycetota bacterium]